MMDSTSETTKAEICMSHALAVLSDPHLYMQCCEDSEAHGVKSIGSMGTTAMTATELAQTSQELNHYLGQNKMLLEQYSHELLHVQSLAAHLVQMSNMQDASG